MCTPAGCGARSMTARRSRCFARCAARATCWTCPKRQCALLRRRVARIEPMRFRPTTVRARLTLWYTLFLGVPLVAFATISFFILTRTLQSQTDAFLLDALAVFAREVVAERRDVPAIDEAIRKTVQ